MKKLTIYDIEVPEAAIIYLAQRGYKEWAVQEIAAHFALWLAENPIVPSEEEAEELREFWCSFANNANSFDYPNDYPEVVGTEWQRRMFLRKTAALPDELKSLLVGGEVCSARAANELIRTAYQLGKEGK